MAHTHGDISVDPLQERHDIHLHMDFDFENGVDLGFSHGVPAEDKTQKKKLKRKVGARRSSSKCSLILEYILLKERDPPSQKENVPHPPGSEPSHSPFSSASFSRRLLTQDDVSTPLQDISLEEHGWANADLKKPKKIARLLLDARTELTDDELRTARAHYLQAQSLLRDSFEQKQRGKCSNKALKEKVWSVPSCKVNIKVGAPALADFWQENFKVQVEARTGSLQILPGGDDSPHKRRKLEKRIDAKDLSKAERWLLEAPTLQTMYNRPTAEYEDVDLLPPDDLRSSEEPGQGRRISRDASITGDLSVEFGTHIADLGSQKSSMFPWDNAGGSSSSGAFGIAESDHNTPLDFIDTRIRGSSQSRRDSSLVPSQGGSLTGDPGLSPAGVKKSQVLDEDYAFEGDCSQL
ncbi:hypothetical protein C0993_000615 [Termitomyces sp. T159_Od127]|nr:hypothetical protein C0993_000615 [Termitomyces sp. T159_Od127]